MFVKRIPSCCPTDRRSQGQDAALRESVVQGKMRRSGSDFEKRGMSLPMSLRTVILAGRLADGKVRVLCPIVGFFCLPRVYSTASLYPLVTRLRQWCQ